MTPEELQSYGTYVRDRAFALGIVRGMELANQTRQFSADVVPAKPKRGFAQVFSADDCTPEHFAKYFTADEDGHYPGWAHLAYGLKWNEFTDRSHLRRVQVLDKNNVKRWVWKRPDQPAGSPGKPSKAIATPTAHPANVAKPSADYHPTAEAETAVAKAIADPSSIRPERFDELANHLDTLQKDKLKEIAKQLQQKLSGPKQELVNRVLQAIRSEANPEDAPGSALAKLPASEPRSTAEGIASRSTEGPGKPAGGVSREERAKQVRDANRRQRAEQVASRQRKFRDMNHLIEHVEQAEAKPVEQQKPSPTPEPLTPAGIASSQSRERAESPVNDPTHLVNEAKEMEAELGRRGYVRNKYGFRDKQGYFIKPGKGWSVKDAAGKWRNLSGTEAHVEYQQMRKAQQPQPEAR